MHRIDYGQPLVGELDDVGLFFGVVRGQSNSIKRGPRHCGTKSWTLPATTGRSPLDNGASNAPRDLVCENAVVQSEKEPVSPMDTEILYDAVLIPNNDDEQVTLHEENAEVVHAIRAVFEIA